MYRAILTKQSTPKEVYNHLIAAHDAGSFPSYGERPTGNMSRGCLYRSHNGQKACYFGIFIPDNKYRPEMDCGMSGKSTNLPGLAGCGSLDVIDYIGKDDFPDFFFEKAAEYESPFIQCLQNTHDRWANDGCFEEKFLPELNALFKRFGHKVTD